MRDFITQVEAAREGNLYYLALAGALMLPDMCAADAEDGTTNRERYGAWFDRWVSPRYVFSGGPPFLTGEDAYGLRCSLLRQGRLRPHRGSYSRVIFVEPGATDNVFSIATC